RYRQVELPVLALPQAARQARGRTARGAQAHGRSGGPDRQQAIAGMPQRKPYRVGRSATGLGLFATETIEEQAEIVEYLGRRIPTRLAQEIDRRRGNKYLFEIDTRWTIDGSTRRNLARYVNHACDPNAEAVLKGDRMVYRALE